MDEFKTSAPPEARLHFLDYWRVIRIRKAIIITVFLITAIIATAVTFILPESYSSTAPHQGGKRRYGHSRHDWRPRRRLTYDPYFIQTTFEIMQSQLVLSNVIAALNLNVEWGKKYFNGETLKTTETMGILKQRMQLTPVRNTKLISITVYSDDPKEAAILANAIADAYQDYRFESRRQLTENGLKTLEAAVSAAGTGHQDQSGLCGAIAAGTAHHRPGQCFPAHAHDDRRAIADLQPAGN